MEHSSMRIIKVIKKFDNEIGKAVANLNHEKNCLLDTMKDNPGKPVDFTDYLVAISQVQEFCDYLEIAHAQSLQLKKECLAAKQILLNSKEMYAEE